MMATSPRQWMADQLQLGHSLCLILDSEGELDARNALLNTRGLEQCRSVYSETQVAGLANSGPFFFIIDNPDDKCLKELLEAPERNWGWFASLRQGELPAFTRHWRERLIIGMRPNQALYRFHDNRVLSRALAHIPEEARPEYLGPAISVCYWQGAGWETTDNPAPDEYPVPDEPSWLSVPLPARQSMDILHTNLYRYLWAEHSDDLVRLGQHQDPGAWLAEQLSQARQWGWLAPEQVHFLILQRLKETELPVIKSWLPYAGETSQAHFERIADEARFWSEERPA